MNVAFKLETEYHFWEVWKWEDRLHIYDGSRKKLLCGAFPPHGAIIDGQPMAAVGSLVGLCRRCAATVAYKEYQFLKQKEAATGAVEIAKALAIGRGVEVLMEMLEEDVGPKCFSCGAVMKDDGEYHTCRCGSIRRSNR